MMDSSVYSNRKRGFVPVYRSLQDNPVWTAERFSKGQAWVDLLLTANHKPGHFYKRGVRIELERGQLGRSKKELMSRWKWSKERLTNFLADLETDQQIRVQPIGRITTVITVIRYDEYNDIRQQTDQQTPQQTTEQTDYIQPLNHENKEGARFSPPSLEEVMNEIENKGYTHVNPVRFHSYYESNGWTVGKNKMKNWHAALRNWNAREKEGSQEDEVKIKLSDYDD